MDVLRDVAHHCIGAAADAGMQGMIGHHAEILCLVDDDMVCLADDFRLFDPLIEVSQCGQVVDVEGGVRDSDHCAVSFLFCQKIMIKFVDRSFPDIGAVMPSVGFEDGFLLRFGVFDTFAQKFFFDLITQAIVQHVDLALDGDGGILPQVAFYGVTLQQADKVTGIGLSSGGIEYAEFTVLKAFYELLRVQVDGFAGDGALFQPAAVALQCPEPGCAALDAVIDTCLCRPGRGAGARCGSGQAFDGVFLVIPIFIQKPYKKFFHGHLTHAVDIQVRQDAGDIIQQDAVAAYDIEIIGAETFFIIVENIRDPVHGHGGLTGTCHALHDDVVEGGLADDLILLFLDRGDDLAQYGLLVFGQIFGEKFVGGNHFAVEIIKQLTRFYLVGAF